MDNLTILEVVYDGNDLYGSRTRRIVDILQKHGLYHGHRVDGIYADFLTPANVPAGVAEKVKTEIWNWDSGIISYRWYLETEEEETELL